jgi:hypothetical protein
MGTKNKRGICTICEEACALTDDHVPPKGSYKPSKVWVRGLVPLRRPDGRIKRRQCQNGVTFQAICGDCNNYRLGNQYDPSLNHLSRKVGQILRVADRVALPDRCAVRIKPQRVARAVVGHLLAAEENPPTTPRQGTMLTAMRRYFLDATEEMPSDLRLFLWPYRGERQTILRGAGIMFNLVGESPPPFVVGDFLKYSPVAFWLTTGIPGRVAVQIADREIDPTGLALDDEVDFFVPTKARDTFRPDWPEAPDDDGALLLDGTACICAEPA